MNLLKRLATTVIQDAVQRPRKDAPFGLSEAWKLGGSLEGLRFTCVAYDPAQSLLAAGASDGSILLVGNQWEFVLDPAPSPEVDVHVTHLDFRVGSKFLIAVRGNTVLSVYNLQTLALQFPSVQLDVRVTCIDVPSNSSWMFVGLADGRVVLYDAELGQRSLYSIPARNADEAPTEETTHDPVVAIRASPSDANLLLLGYQSGVMILWDIKDQAVRRKFGFDKGAEGGKLTNVCWHPDGTFFAAATVSAIAFWETRSRWLDGLKASSITKPTKVLKRNGTDDELKLSTAVARQRLLWWSEVKGGGSFLVANAATGIENYICGTDISSIKSSGNIPPDGCVRDFQVMRDPTSASVFLMTIDIEGILHASLFNEDVSSLHVAPSFELATLRSPSTVAMSECSEFLGWDIRKLAETGNASGRLPLNGGTVVNKNGKQLFDVLCTNHLDQKLRFWKLGRPPALLFEMPCVEDSPSEPLVSMDLDQRLLLVAIGPHVTTYRWVLASEVKEADPEEDADELMRRLDATVDEILRQSEDINQLTGRDDRTDQQAEELDSTEAAHDRAENPESSTIEEEPEGNGQIADESAEAVGKNPPPPDSKAADDLADVPPPLSKDDKTGLPSPPASSPITYRYVDDTPTGPGWTPFLHYDHEEPVQLMTFAPLCELLVTTTAGNNLHVMRGRSITTTTVTTSTSTSSQEQSDANAEIVMVQVGYTYYKEEPSPRTCIFVFTSAGACIQYKVADDSEGRITLEGCTIHQPNNNTTQIAVCMFILDEGGRLVRPGTSRTGSEQSPENYVAMCFSNSTAVYLLHPEEGRSLLASCESREEGVKAGLCFIGGDPVLIRITATATVEALELPGLRLIWRAQLPLVTPDARRLRETLIIKDGRLVIWTDEREFRMFCITKDTSRIPEIQIRAYELTKAMEWSRQTKGSATSSTRNREHDQLFKPRSDLQQPTSHARTTGVREGGAASTADSPFARATQALNERGEKLNQLEAKFGDLEDGSKTFLDTIKQYNDRQVRTG
ncbi:uncharacterized protein EV422DRAFT_541576 [Fimicolochytrium jonesii]|uniref:uncharacterized protein n=1 Tax=Fimicolochytrium jonesii TaxID=1396493 RepID=UPI0022FE60B7|nr:uncharacterized protein EV422DRAFT_541576 [Fimicolochytrium jonesii]KAI8817376.1 hypothetical protein EV422DRAFT_541576 [Fimicolochytrium jonesii]